MILFTRRRLLSGAAALAAAAPARAFAFEPDEAPPIVFIHGNGESAALWMTQVWRFESNGWPRDRLFALNFTDPLARSDDAVAQAGRSSSEDQKRELAAFIEQVRGTTGAAKTALVAHSRGGYAARNFASTPAGAEQIAAMALCGVPNHGVYAADFNPGSEFNGRAALLARLNGGEFETPPGVPVLTLRSDGQDKFAQPDGRAVGRPGVPTGVDATSPELRGAQNLVLGALDHRELAFHPRAFIELFRFLARQDPARLAITREPQVTLDGIVTGFPNGVPTNRPLPDATVEVFRVDPDTGERRGAPIHQKITGPDGRWGPVTIKAGATLEFVLTAPGHPATHIYRSAFPRSTTLCHLRPARPLDKSDAGAGAVVLLSRPRGYFGLPRDAISFDGRQPKDITPGVPVDSISTLRRKPEDLERPVVALFNEERIVARPWPAAEGRITVIELTW